MELTWCVAAVLSQMWKVCVKTYFDSFIQLVFIAVMDLTHCQTSSSKFAQLTNTTARKKERKKRHTSEYYYEFVSYNDFSVWKPWQLILMPKKDSHSNGTVFFCAGKKRNLFVWSFIWSFFFSSYLQFLCIFFDLRIYVLVVCCW